MLNRLHVISFLLYRKKSLKIEASIVGALKGYSVKSNAYCVPDCNFLSRWCRVAIEGDNKLAYAVFFFFFSATLATCTFITA